MLAPAPQLLSAAAPAAPAIIASLAAPSSPARAPAHTFAALTGWVGIGAALLLIVLVCAVAIISRHRLRVAAGIRAREAARKKAKTESARRLDPWTEAAKRMPTPHASDQEEGAGPS